MVCWWSPRGPEGGHLGQPMRSRSEELATVMTPMLLQGGHTPAEDMSTGGSGLPDGISLYPTLDVVVFRKVVEFKV